MSRTFIDLEYARAGDKELLLNLALPDGMGPFPVVIWIHGGGWEYGNKDERPVVRLVDDGLLQRGYAIAAINHRLSTEATFPAPLEDCKASVRWLRANAAVYKLDADMIGVWGFSSGGHLAALLGTTAAQADFAGDGGNAGYASRVQAVCTFAAPIDFLAQIPELDRSGPNAAMIYELAVGAETKLLGASPLERPDLARRANPITYVDDASAPFLLITGDSDELIPVSQGELMTAALHNAGVAASTYVIPAGPHGMSGLPDDETAKIINMVGDFFDQQLRSTS